MEVHYFECDVCGRQIELGKRIRATQQRIHDYPSVRYSIDFCDECWARIRKEAKKESEVK